MKKAEIQKRCSACERFKDISLFYKDSTKKDGHTPICAVCKTKIRRSKIGVLRKVYSAQRESSKKRGHPLPNYEVAEFVEWGMKQRKYHKLHKKWERGGYKKHNVPSCDRLDETKPYTFSNIEIVSWEKNIARICAKRVNGEFISSTVRGVIRISKATGEKKKFHSIAAAAKSAGIPQQSVSQCCHKKQHRKSAGGFVWKFKKTKV